MIEWFDILLQALLQTLKDILPIAITIIGFQAFILRKPLRNVKQLAMGFIYVIIGMVLFLQGLELALFPLGTVMAQQLTDPSFLLAQGAEHLEAIRWQDYGWVYAFAAAIGFATTMAEPALIAIAIKAEEVLDGAISTWGLRFAVATGVAIGIGLGTIRIVQGAPLHLYIIAAYALVMIQTLFAPRNIIPLAYDTGGVTTSTVTVPIIAALGIGLASSVPGRSPILDGFGLIAFAALFPIITVMAFAQITSRLNKKR